MHEFSIAVTIVNTIVDVLKEEGGKKVTEIDIEVGQFSGVVIDSLEFAMQQAVKGTTAQDSVINIVYIPGLIYCETCYKEFKSDLMYASCPYCGDSNTKIIKGDEMQLKSIEIE